APRRGASGPRRPADAARGRSPPPMPDLSTAINGYLTYLHIERGLAPATIRAYRADLHDYEASRGATRGWASSPDAAVGYLAATTRPGRRNHAGLAPSR